MIHLVSYCNDHRYRCLSIHVAHRDQKSIQSRFRITLLYFAIPNSMCGFCFISMKTHSQIIVYPIISNMIITTSIQSRSQDTEMLTACFCSALDFKIHKTSQRKFRHYCSSHNKDNMYGGMVNEQFEQTNSVNNNR